LALPTPTVNPELFAGGFPEKTVDVFFAGEVDHNSWVRRTGLEEIRKLREKGIVVSLPEGRLSVADFYKELARAWLAWSPAGMGWQCYRTGEAALCLTVPIVNQPTVERDLPLLDGQHLFQYDVEPGGLTRAIEEALSDKDRLRRMALAARRHVLENHTLKAIVDRVLETALAARPS
jgi:hypothetical protein